ncbi:MAG: sensor histidine kinase [Archangiaceae bacterium]|nr:sensor histidine kinase [Archangiaceae bacterium]
MDKNFTVDARAILHLGRESIRDHTTAVIELVKNSYDADATRVDIEICATSPDPTQHFIRVRDNGSGMTDSDLDTKWLRIGYSAKRTKKVSPILGRRTTGEKGIGRISADRLGATLELVTAAPRNAATGLLVDWAEFESSRKPLNEIPIKTMKSPVFAHDTNPKLKELGIPQWTYPAQGTELTARGLRHVWTTADAERLRRELTAFLSPYAEVEDFELFLLTDLGPDLSGKIVGDIPDNAAVDLAATFDGVSTVSYTIKSGAGPKSPKKSISWDQLVQKATSDLRTSQPIVGPLTLRLLFFPRKPETSALSNLSLAGLREFLDDNSGVRIYRDSIRVKPYGDHTEHGGDWLLLGDRKARDPAGAARPTFRVSPNQLVGAVFVSRDRNENIVDSAAREGLISNLAFSQLRAIALGCVSLLEAAYHEAYEERDARESQGDVRAKVGDLNSRLSKLAEDLNAAQKVLPPKASGVVKASAEKIGATLKAIEATSRSIELLASQATIYRGLATTGIAATVFGHETQSSIAQVEGSVSTALLLVQSQPPKVALAVEELEKAQAFAARVGSWGTFALTRIQRDKRRRKVTDIRAVAERLAKEITPVLGSVDIDLRLKLSDVTGKTFAMDIESVLVNLLTNAYAACQQKQGERIVRLEVGPKTRDAQHGVVLVVADSGPGVADEFKDRVWEPLLNQGGRRWTADRDWSRTRHRVVHRR